MKEKSVVINFRLPASWKKVVEKIAKDEARSEASVIRQAIKNLIGEKK